MGDMIAFDFSAAGISESPFIRPLPIKTAGPVWGNIWGCRYYDFVLGHISKKLTEIGIVGQSTINRKSASTA